MVVADAFSPSNPFEVVKLHLSKLIPPVLLPSSIRCHRSPFPGPVLSSPASLSSSPLTSNHSVTYVLSMARPSAVLATLRESITASGGQVSDSPPSPLSAWRVGPVLTTLTPAEVTAAIEAKAAAAQSPSSVAAMQLDSASQSSSFVFPPFVVTKMVVVAHGVAAGTYAEVLATGAIVPSLAKLYLPEPASSAALSASSLSLSSLASSAAAATGRSVPTNPTPLFSISYPRERVCTKCWAKGHSAALCRSTPLCPLCQGNHNKSSCLLPIAQRQCLLCSSHQHSITGCGRFKSKFIRSDGIVPPQQQQQRQLKPRQTQQRHEEKHSPPAHQSQEQQWQNAYGALAPNSSWGGARRKSINSNNGDAKRGAELKNHHNSSVLPLPSSSTSHSPLSVSHLSQQHTSTSLGASPSMLAFCIYLLESGLSFLRSSASSASPVPHSRITEAIKQLQALLRAPNGTAPTPPARPHGPRTASATEATTATASTPATRARATAPVARAPVEQNAKRGTRNAERDAQNTKHKMRSTSMPRLQQQQITRPPAPASAPRTTAPAPAPAPAAPAQAPAPAPHATASPPTSSSASISTTANQSPSVVLPCVTAFPSSWPSSDRQVERKDDEQEEKGKNGEEVTAAALRSTCSDSSPPFSFSNTHFAPIIASSSSSLIAPFDPFQKRYGKANRQQATTTAPKPEGKWSFHLPSSESASDSSSSVSTSACESSLAALTSLPAASASTLLSRSFSARSHRVPPIVTHQKRKSISPLPIQLSPVIEEQRDGKRQQDEASAAAAAAAAVVVPSSPLFVVPADQPALPLPLPHDLL